MVILILGIGHVRLRRMDPDVAEKIKTLEFLSQRRNEALKKVADTIMGLSAASLSVVIAFRGAFSGNYGRGFLKAALCFYAIALLTGLAAQFADVVVYQKLIKRLRDNRDLADAPGLWASVCYFSTLIAFALATIFLTFYGILNI